ncbi:MAG: glycosyltransferase family 2 protein [Lachnospiraceae bacterium]|nr:glycosyltransferase family 2 protein [Lachnospiraceae bacterium]
MNRVPVTAVIPNYNGKECIFDCLDSILAGTLVPEIIVVDNGSSDGSPEAVREKYPQVRVIGLRTNTGFCHAVNTGIHAARTEYVFLLNNDTVAEKDCVEKLLEEISTRDRLFSVQAMMLAMQKDAQGMHVVDDAGDHLDITGAALAAGKGYPMSALKKSIPVFSSCAGAAIYRMRCFEEIGLFDERHFCYLEDVDIGWRAQIFGYRSRCRTDAVVYHKGSAASGSRYNVFKQELAAANNYYIQYKNMPRLQYILNYPAMALGRAAKRRYFAQKGLEEAYNKGLSRGRLLVEAAKVQLLQERYEQPSGKTDLVSEAMLAGREELVSREAADRLRCFNPLYRGTKVPFIPGNIPNYIRIQLMMVRGTLMRLKKGRI